MPTFHVEALTKEARYIKGGKYKGQICTGMLTQGDKWINVLGDHTGAWQQFKGKNVEFTEVEGGKYPVYSPPNAPGATNASSTTGNTGTGQNVRPRPDLAAYVRFLQDASDEVTKWHLAVPEDHRGELIIHLGMAFLKGEITWEPKPSQYEPDAVVEVDDITKQVPF